MARRRNLTRLGGLVGLLLGCVLVMATPDDMPFYPEASGSRGQPWTAGFSRPDVDRGCRAQAVMLTTSEEPFCANL